MSSTAKNISPGYPVLNSAHGQVSAELGKENISLSLPFVLSLPIQLSFSGVCPQLTQESAVFI